MLRVALVGCGHMGRHHARTIAAQSGCEVTAAIDIVPERAAAIAQATGAGVVERVPDDIDAVVIATPTSTHAEVAGPLLQRGHWCLVEKPLAATEAEAQALASPRLIVGHVERFNPAVRALGIVAPRFVQARRLSPPSPRGRDVDVVLDLMIHDLDLVLWWSGDEEVEIVDAVGVSAHADDWDVASVRLRSASGLTASLTASRIADDRERVIHVFEPGRAAALDLLTGVAVDSKTGQQLPGDGAGDGLTAQWAAFRQAVRGEGGPAPCGIQATRALRLAGQVRDTLRRR